ncbi:MAG: hypothetical protein QOI07_935 [Verrucomicrobiota bacterium]|jgi:hypothetical protein
MKRKNGQQKGERHPVHFVATELGVDRNALTKRLDVKGVDCSEGVTFREAFAAWTSKDERDADRARQQKADADSAELDAATKRGDLMFAKDAEQRWADLTIEWRKTIQAKPKWESAALLKELSKIKLDEQ